MRFFAVFLFIANFIFSEEVKYPLGVCPPFHLKDEEGNIINPRENLNSDKPYSPKKPVEIRVAIIMKKSQRDFILCKGRGKKFQSILKKGITGHPRQETMGEPGVLLHPYISF